MIDDRASVDASTLEGKDFTAVPTGHPVPPIAASGEASSIIRPSLIQLSNQRSNSQRRSRRFKTRISGTEAQEAAWQILSRFINPIDCCMKVHFPNEGGEDIPRILCMNRGEDLIALYAKQTGRWINRISKANFIRHADGIQPIYYRSKWHAPATTGFGAHSNTHQRLVFNAERFGMASKKIVEKDTYILLAGGDIDCHHGETDMPKTLGVVLDMFPGSYYETSTNGLGIHVYVKLKYGQSVSLATIQNQFAVLSKAIESQRIKRGYDAPFDGFRSIPSRMTWATTIKRSNVIKLPFYRNCSLETVHAFYDSPWFNSTDIDRLCGQVYEDENDSTNSCITGEAAVLRPVEASLPPLLHNRASPHDRDADLYGIADSHQRRLQFALRLSRELGYVPTWRQLKGEYQNAGLLKPDSKSDNADDRYRQIVAFIAKTFDSKKVKFSYADYAIHRIETEAGIRERTAGLELRWKSGSRQKPLTIEKLAALYWAIKHSMGNDDATPFSYRHCKIALKQTVNKSPNSTEVAALLKSLESMKLISRVGHYVIGLKAQSWKVHELMAAL